MFPKLLAHTSYSKVGDYFSKLLFLWDNLEHHRGGILHIVNSLAEQKKYQKIAADIGISYKVVDDYDSIANIGATQNIIWSIEIDNYDSWQDKKLLDNKLVLEKAAHISSHECITKLDELWYSFNEYMNPGTYKRSGDIVDITTVDGKNYKISFWWDEIDEIFPGVDSLSLWDLQWLIPIKEEWRNTLYLPDLLSQRDVYIILDNLDFHHSYEKFISYPYKLSSMDNLAYNEDTRSHQKVWVESLHLDTIEDLKSTLWDSKTRSQVYTKHDSMIEEFLKENKLWHITVFSIKNHISTSFSLKNTYIITDDIISKIFIRKRIKRKLSADIDLLLKIKNGDYVVHIDHGIGVFQWIIKKQLWDIEKEYLHISYSDNDNLFVPITEVSRVSKYVWSENPKLTPLSGKVWERKIQKVHENIREIASELLKNFAERKLRKWKKNIVDKEAIKKFQWEFPYSYTDDQKTSIEDIMWDMSSDKNMDRLLVGDVGFWKTEIAFNAMKLALLNKKQILFISPLVVLAHEHYSKAIERFSGYNYNIEVLTRLQSAKNANRIIKWLKDGSIDMVIGTHRLLWENVGCKNLWLMVIDEEHKFWVSDKEKIKKIKSDIDILSLSATPIPRSLNLALSWVRDISLIKTPPGGRKNIETSVLRYNEQLIVEAWKREFARGWQIFFVHNRVSNIEAVKKQLEILFPKKKVIITHGGLPGEELENRILDFKERKYDILLSTTVIENGIDFSNVNTIFINECQQFWISQIHQLRGRVWRSDRQWYCYLLYRKEKIDGEAAKRLQTIVDYSYLWAGFELAMKDLEIRGWWDILGIRQSGQASDIWVSLFLKMLEEKIQELKEQQQSGKHIESVKNPSSAVNIDLMITASIPDSYFLSETDKLNFYREIELIRDVSDIEFLKNELFTLNSDIPKETENLFLILETQILAQKYSIESIKKVGMSYQIDFAWEEDIETLKSFLKLDREVRFTVISWSRLRTPTKGFAKQENFLQYLLQLLWAKQENPKIKLVKKHKPSS